MSAQAAINQIDLKDYSSKFSLSGLPIVKVGINFDPERRTIGDWKIEYWRLNIDRVRGTGTEVNPKSEVNPKWAKYL